MKVHCQRLAYRLDGEKGNEMQHYKVIYWFGSIITERVVLATTADEAIKKLDKNTENIIKVEAI